MQIQTIADRSAAGRSLGAIAVGLLVVTAACGSSGDDTGITVATADVTETVASTIDDMVERLRDEGLASAASALAEVDVASLVDGPEFTFFAPDDEAFQALDPDELADLLADPERLGETLQNHLVDERMTADDIGAVGTVETVAGNTLAIETSGDEISIDGVTVVSTDMDLDDGVVHVVDGFFLP